jgi:hypothetical protein
MSISKTVMDDNLQRLATAIGRTIQEHTSSTPIPHEHIVSVLAYCAGAAIGQAQSRNVRRQMKEMAEASIGFGIEYVVGKPSGLILPGDLN